LVGAWYASGALGVPRRFAVHPPGTEGYSLIGSIFVIVFALGFLLLLAEFVRLGRDALRRRRAVGRAPPAPTGWEAAGPVAPPPEPPLATLWQISAAVAVATVAVFAFIPSVTDASLASDQWHHLSHAAQFTLGLATGVALASTPSVFERFAPRWSEVGLAAVVLAPAAMLLAMIPAVYEPLEDNDVLHAAYHIGIVSLGGLAGFGAALLGRVAGRLLLLLSVGMALMYAAGVTGGCVDGRRVDERRDARRGADSREAWSRGAGSRGMAARLRGGSRDPRAAGLRLHDRLQPRTG
jgi:hypothetical protein